MIDQQQLADLRAKAEAATLGPWEASEECVVQPLPKHISPLGLTGGSSIMVAECGGVAFDSPRPADAAYIAAANPATVLAMIDEIERLRGRLASITSSLHEVAQSLQNGMDTNPNSSCDIFATLLYMHGLWRGRDLAKAKETK